MPVLTYWSDASCSNFNEVTGSTEMPSSSIKKGYSLYPCEDPLYFIILIFRVEILSTTGLSRRITQSATYSSSPYLVSEFSPRSPVITAVNSFDFSQVKSLRSSARKMNSFGKPENSASIVSKYYSFRTNLFNSIC